MTKKTEMNRAMRTYQTEPNGLECCNSCTWSFMRALRLPSTPKVEFFCTLRDDLSSVARAGWCELWQIDNTEPKEEGTKK